MEKVEKWEFNGDQGSLRAQVGVGNTIKIITTTNDEYVGRGISAQDRIGLVGAEVIHRSGGWVAANGLVFHPAQ